MFNDQLIQCNLFILKQEFIAIELVESSKFVEIKALAVHEFEEIDLIDLGKLLVLSHWFWNCVV